MNFAFLFGRGTSASAARETMRFLLKFQVPALAGAYSRQQVLPVVDSGRKLFARRRFALCSCKRSVIFATHEIR
jgi:hypothetical protein